MLEKPIAFPAMYPQVIMPDTMTITVTAADPPTFINFLKLNSNPNENSRKIMPNSAQKSMFDSLIMVGKYPKWGLTRKPARIYPSTTGCFSRLNITVEIPATTSINARSEIIYSISLVAVCF